jgi:Xaa-Pro aminopeptidase
VAAHLELLKRIRPGLKEYQVQAIIEYEFKMRGSEAPAYNSICAAGKNATCLHYEPQHAKLKAGELVLVDAGCEYRHYSSDITRTYPVDGKFTPAQKNIMAIVAEAHQEAIAQARSGKYFKDFHDAASSAIAEGLRSLKFLKGSQKEVMQSGTYKKYFPHGTGHWLGLDVHDPAPSLDSKSKSMKLKPGMIFTVEPGIYISTQDKSVPEEYRGIGVRIEDDVLVTRSKPEILTDGLPRYTAEIEKFMK